MFTGETIFFPSLFLSLLCTLLSLVDWSIDSIANEVETTGFLDEREITSSLYNNPVGLKINNDHSG